MSQSRVMRAVRGSVAAGVAVFVALVSHVSGGGQMPGWVGLAVPAVLSVVVCTVLAGKQLSLWRLSIAVALSQVLFHTLFVLGTFSPSTTAAASTSHHSHSATVATVVAPAMASVHTHPDASMWVMHGIAALLTIALLYRGERACLRLREITVELIRWARRRLIPTIIAFLIVPERADTPMFAEPSRPVVSPLVFSLVRRGPPTVAVF